MKGDLIINNTDAFEKWGVSMGKSFIESLYAPSDLKAFVENESRLENGKRVLYNLPRYAPRDVTLLFYLEGVTKSDYLSKYDSFCSELAKGKIEIKVPKIDTKVFRLTYTKSQNFALDTNRTFSQITIKFNEPNPANRA